jgi:hypothetical protein
MSAYPGSQNVRPRLIYPEIMRGLRRTTLNGPRWTAFTSDHLIQADVFNPSGAYHYPTATDWMGKVVARREIAPWSPLLYGVAGCSHSCRRM